MTGSGPRREAQAEVKGVGGVAEEVEDTEDRVIVLMMCVWDE